MNMTENEAIEWLKHTRAYQHKCDNCEYIDINGACNEECKDFYDLAIQALEEIQQYRAIGTVEELKTLKENNLTALEMADLWCVLEDLKRYSAIGTIDEFKALKEKKSEWEYCRKENIATCKHCSYEHYLGTYHQYATNYCPNCGSKMTET